MELLHYLFQLMHYQFQRIYKAANKCSTVDTLIPNLFSNVVHNFVDETFCNQQQLCYFF